MKTMKGIALLTSQIGVSTRPLLLISTWASAIGQIFWIASPVRLLWGNPWMITTTRGSIRILMVNIDSLYLSKTSSELTWIKSSSSFGQLTQILSICSRNTMPSGNFILRGRVNTSTARCVSLGSLPSPAQNTEVYNPSLASRQRCVTSE